MRQIAIIPHASIQITLFAWNGKYLVKAEQGPLEQTYKLPEADTLGDKAVEALCRQPEFLEKLQAQFEAMGAVWQYAMNEVG